MLLNQGGGHFLPIKEETKYSHHKSIIEVIGDWNTIENTILKILKLLIQRCKFPHPLRMKIRGDFP